MVTFILNPIFGKFKTSATIKPTLY